MEMPQNARAFEAFMVEIWGAEQEAHPDGGIILYSHPDYDKYHNAKFTARTCGARRTGATMIDGESWEVYRFPDDGDNVAYIRPDGAGVTTGLSVYAPRRRRAA